MSRCVAVNEILLRQNRRSSRNIVIPVKNPNGHSHRRAKKLPNVTHSVQKHQAGAAGAQGGLGCWLPIPSPREGATRKARPGVSRAQDGCIRARLLLARAFLPEREDSRAELSNVEREVQRKQGQRCPKHQATEAGGMVRADSLGVPVGCGGGKVVGHPGPSICAKAQKGWAAVARLRWHPRGASIMRGRADNLVAESRRRPGEAGGGTFAPCVRGALADSSLSQPMENLHSPSSPTFIDLFSGCGGLSLGLSQAGWQGLFAIERATDAFETFRANFLKPESRCKFKWPAWLEQSAHSIDDVLTDHEFELAKLNRKVDLIAGGPPCQGFSFAGRRNNADPRNKMFQRYVTFVKLIEPKFLVLENVPGMNIAHTRHGNKAARRGETYYDKLSRALVELGYAVEPMILDAADFGVPQHRERLVVIGMRNDVAKSFPAGCVSLFNKINSVGKAQLAELGGGKLVGAKQALSDLAVGSGRAREQNTIEYTGAGARAGYVQKRYTGPDATPYQLLMNKGVDQTQMDSMRLARHREDVEDRFRDILATSRRGVNLSLADRERFGMLKHRTVPMSPSVPAPTLTTLPDDIIHYSDPRILTVRECARLQSFPDWFLFEGKYTTGGARRKSECPRYTQVGNAVPPLLAQAIGSGILESWRASGAKVNSGVGRKVVIKKKDAAAMRL